MQVSAGLLNGTVWDRRLNSECIGLRLEHCMSRDVAAGYEHHRRPPTPSPAGRRKGGAGASGLGARRGAAGRSGGPNPQPPKRLRNISERPPPHSS